MRTSFVTCILPIVMATVPLQVTLSAGDETKDNSAPNNLVRALVSSNPRPTIGRRGPVIVAKISDTFSWDEQKRIVGAINELTQHAELAWPELIAGRESPEYCITIYADSRIYNRS